MGFSIYLSIFGNLNEIWDTIISDFQEIHYEHIITFKDQEGYLKRWEELSVEDMSKKYYNVGKDFIFKFTPRENVFIHPNMKFFNDFKPDSIRFVFELVNFLKNYPDYLESTYDGDPDNDKDKIFDPTV